MGPGGGHNASPEAENEAKLMRVETRGRNIIGKQQVHLQSGRGQSEII